MATFPSPPVNFFKNFVYSIPIETRITVFVVLQSVVCDPFEVKVISDSTFNIVPFLSTAFLVPHLHEQLKRIFDVRRIDGHSHPKKFFMEFD